MQHTLGGMGRAREVFPLVLKLRLDTRRNGLAIWVSLQNRGGQIRTDDFLLPKQALYQAELRPVMAWGR